MWVDTMTHRLGDTHTRSASTPRMPPKSRISEARGGLCVLMPLTGSWAGWSPTICVAESLCTHTSATTAFLDTQLRLSRRHQGETDRV